MINRTIKDLTQKLLNDAMTMGTSRKSIHAVKALADVAEAQAKVAIAGIQYHKQFKTAYKDDIWSPPKKAKNPVIELSKAAATLGKASHKVKKSVTK